MVAMSISYDFIHHPTSAFLHTDELSFKYSHLILIIYTFMVSSIRNNLIYPTPPLGQDVTQGQFFKQN